MKQCKLVISDEVNCQFIDLDVSDRRRLHNLFSYEKPGARYMPAVRLGRWNGKVPYFNLNGNSYINLLPEILPYLDERNYDVELIDNRDYKTSFEFTQVDENFFEGRVWPVGHEREGQPIVLRDYQIKIVNDFFQHPQSIQEVATGAGKTITSAVLSKSVESYGRSIVIVPNKSLVGATEADYINVGMDVGVYFGDRKEYNKTHTVCTWQSLNNLLKSTKSGDADVTIQDFIEGVVMVLVDECFDGDSLVLTPTGYVPIKNIQPGDTVLNYSESNGLFKEDIVVKRHENLTKSLSEKMYEMEFDNGEKIKVTGNHKFLTSTGWVRADELNEHHEIISTKP